MSCCNRPLCFTYSVIVSYRFRMPIRARLYAASLNCSCDLSNRVWGNIERVLDIVNTRDTGEKREELLDG